ncbi:MAG: hypothetical protein ACREF7_04745, partial [Candidatus Saccharimonadales bacterium]
MYSPELVKTNEKIPEYLLVDSDKQWLEVLGCTWDETENPNRLNYLNDLLILAAEPVEVDSVEPNSPSLSARNEFIGQLGKLDYVVRERLIRHPEWQLTPRTVIG